jgi:hypothetical protein
MSGPIRLHLRLLAAITGAIAAACSGGPSPALPTAATPTSTSARSNDNAGAGTVVPAEAPWGPESPNFNLEVILRGNAGGFGHVKFRQPNDGDLIVYLDTWVRDLRPLTSYVLQRAVDTTLDGVCTGTGWLTLGKGTTPQAITTDERGFGSEQLFRNLSAFPVGTTFDIHFRVVEQATSAVALTSDCYQFTISQ